MSNAFNHADICSAETGEILHSIRDSQLILWDWKEIRNLVAENNYEIVAEEISYNTYTIYVK